MNIIWNPDDKNANISLSNGNLTAFNSSGGWHSLRNTNYKSSGKYYWEITVDVANGVDNLIGVATSATSLSSYCGSDAYSYGYYGNGTAYHSGSYSSYGVGYGTGDIVGVALDLDVGKIWWSINGAWQNSGDPAAGTNAIYSSLSGDFYVMGSMYNSGNQMTVNFGPDAFIYSIPEGFVAFQTPGHYFSGYVYEGANTISGAQLYLYNRDTGEYINSTTSSGDGGFYITTTYTGSNFLVCLDPSGGQVYNDLIYGNMYPATFSG